MRKYVKLIWVCTIAFWAVNVFGQESIKFDKNHDKAIITNVFSNDGSEVSCLTADKTIKVYDSKTGQLIKTLNDNGDGSVSLSYAADSKWLATACFDKTIKIWNTTKGTVDYKLYGHSQPSRCVSFSPDGNFLASGGADNKILIWYFPLKLCYKTLDGHKQSIRSLAFSPDGRCVASSGNDLKLKLWNLLTGKEQFSIKASDYPVEAVCYSPDGKYIATAGMENNIRLWDAKNGNLYKVLKGHTGCVYALSFSSDGKYLASGGDDNIVKIWNIESGQAINNLKGHSKGIRSISFSPDGKMLVSGGIDKRMIVWLTTFLNTTPNMKVSKLKNISENGSLFSWGNIKEDYATSLTKKYSFKVEVDNSKMSNYVLYVNKSPYTQLVNQKAEPVKPLSIKKVGNKTELIYEVLLEKEENEIVVYGEMAEQNGYAFSREFNLRYFNLSECQKNAHLRSYIISPKNYSDQKLNFGFEININFELENTNKFKDVCMSQQGKLFKSATVRCPDDNKYLSRKNIIRSCDSIAMISKQQDVFLVIISGLFVKNSKNEIFLIAPNTSLKNFASDLVNIESFALAINKTPSFGGIIVDPSRKLSQYPKGYSGVSAKEVYEYLNKTLQVKRDYSLLVVDTDEYLQLFDLLFSVFYPYNDSDKNGIIDFNELNHFISQLYKTHFMYKGKFVPLYMTF